MITHSNSITRPENNLAEKEPRYFDFYQPSEQQKQDELLFVGGFSLSSNSRECKIVNAKLAKVLYSSQGYWKLRSLCQIELA